MITWQQKSETILLWCGLALFILTAGYVAQKRALYFVPEALRPMSVIKTTYRIIMGGTGSKILQNKRSISSATRPSTRRRKEASSQQLPPPSPKVMSTKPQNVPESVSKPVEVVDEVVEIKVVEEPETQAVKLAETTVEATVDPDGDVIEKASEPDSDDDFMANVHVEL